MSDQDHYRSTRPMGRPFDGSVPRYQSTARLPDPESHPYPSGRPGLRQPIPGRVVRTPGGPITPQQPTPVYPPEPFISQMETARNTKQIATDIRIIRWVLIAIFISMLVLVATELSLAVKISNIVTLTTHF